MDWQRVKTVVLYSWYHLTHSMETLVDLFWFPVVEMVVFGLVAQYFREASGDGQFVSFFLLGFVFWEAVRVGQYSITVNVLWDVWSRSFSSLFVTPVTMREFVTGQAISGFLKAAVVSVVTAVLAYLFGGLNVLMLGPVLVVYFVLLLMFSWAAGLFTTGLIFRFGTDIQSLSWGLIFVVQPISALFYPVSVLPQDVRWVAYLSPITYVMESARSQLGGGGVWWGYLGWALVLSVVYLGLTGYYFARQVEWAKRTGAFARMEG